MTDKQKELADAKEWLQKWKDATKALMTGQEYRMGTRFLRRVDAKECREWVKYWQDEIARLEGKSHIRVQQMIPRDN